MAERKIKPEFTKAQAAEIRTALRGQIDFRTKEGFDARASRNALAELDRAELAVYEPESDDA